MPSEVRVRLAGVLPLAIFCTALMLPARQIFAFSLQDYEGGFQLGRWDGSAQGGYLFEDEDSHSPTSSLSLLRDRFDELLKIKNDGMSFIDPRLLIGGAGLDLDLYQEQDRYSHKSSYSDGLLWGYNLDATLLPQLPENATLFANQTQNEVNTTFGGRTRVDNSNLGILAQITEDSVLKDQGLYYFSSRLDAREEENDQTTTQLGESSKLDQLRYVVDYDAHKGFETGDLRFRYHFADVHDTGSAHLVFQNQDAHLSYSLDFGPNLNRSWDSDVDYFSLTGTTPTQNLLVNEALRIAHYTNLATNLLYSFAYSNVKDEGTTTSHLGTLQVLYNIYENLAQEFSAGGTLQTLPQGQITSYYIEGSDNYTRPIPWRGVFFLSMSAQYQVEDNNLSSSAIQVTNELHTAVATGFNLNNSFIIASTIVVKDNTQGMVTTVFNVDYSIVQTGNLTQIIPIPTSLIIHLGDQLSVSYTYNVPANAKFSTTSRSVSVGVSYPWLEFSYSYDAYDQGLLSGNAGQFLQHQVSQIVDVDVHHEWEKIEARTHSTYQDLNSSNIAYTRKDFSQYVAYHPDWETSLDANGQESFTNYTLPKRQATYYSLHIGWNRFFQDGLTTSLFGGVRDLRNTAFPTETDIELVARAIYTIGKLQVSPSVTWTDRTFGGVKSNDLMFQLTISRQFF